MKKRFSFLLSLFLVLVLALGAVPATSANTVRTATVDVSVLNVRSGPGLQHSRIGQVTMGAVLPVLGEQLGWLQVSLGNGQSGWVSAQYVTVNNTPPVVQLPALTAKVNTSVLNVRSGPGTSFSRLTTVTLGTVLPVLKREGAWLQVRLPDGQTGWVAGEYTVVTEASAPTSGQLPVTNTPATPAPSPSSSALVMVSVPVLNVRSGPGTTFARITTANEGTMLTVLQNQGDWLQVRLPGGQTGWVAATYTTTLPVAPAPIPSTPASPPTAQLPSPAAEQERIVTVSVNASTAWSGPGFEGRQVAVLSQGTSLPVIAEQGDWLQVRLPDGQAAWIGSWLVAKSPGSVPPSPVNNGGSTVPPDTGTPSPGASSLAGKVIVIDPGHGGSNPGAIGVTGLVEKDVVLDVSLRLAQKLRQAGATVIMTRSTDTTVFLAARVAIAEQAGAHAFVSIHANAHPNRAISGTETYYYRYKPNYMESYYLAAHLQNELVKALGLRDIGIKHGNFHVIRETTMPSALVELAFLSNPHDEALMKTAQFRENAAQAIYRGLERFFQF